VGQTAMKVARHASDSPDLAPSDFCFFAYHPASFEPGSCIFETDSRRAFLVSESI
jgi:hypothetical protein